MKLAALLASPSPPPASAPVVAGAESTVAFGVDLAQCVQGAEGGAVAAPAATSAGTPAQPPMSFASDLAASGQDPAISLESLLQTGAAAAPIAHAAADTLRLRARAALEQALHAHPAAPQAQADAPQALIGWAALPAPPLAMEIAEAPASPPDLAAPADAAAPVESAWGLPPLLPAPIPAPIAASIPAPMREALAPAPSTPRDTNATLALTAVVAGGASGVAPAAPQASVAVLDAVALAWERPGEASPARDALRPMIDAQTAAPVSGGFAAALAPALATGAERTALPGAPPPIPIHQPQAPQQLAETVIWQLDAAVQEAQIQLHPQELGPLEVKVRIEGEKVAVRFDMADASVRDVVQSSLPNLASLLSARGLALDQAQVFSQQRGHAGSPQSQAPERNGPGSKDKTESVGAAPRRVLHRGVIDHYA